MNDIKLCPVGHNDAQFLFFLMNNDIILETLNEVPTQLSDWNDAITAWMSDEDEEDYIIKCEETPIGWLAVNGLSSTDKISYIKMVAILPEYHNKGIGSYVVNQIVEMLNQRNYSRIILYTNKNNCKALSCYKKCGFEIVHTFVDEMSNGELVTRCKMEQYCKGVGICYTVNANKERRY